MTPRYFMPTKRPWKFKMRNGMRINPTKLLIVMGKTQTMPHFVFFFGNTEIHISKDFEMPRVMIDDKLKFEKHEAKVCRKVSQQVAILKHMKKFVPLWNKKIHIFCFHPSHLNYCFETWHFCSNGASAILEKVSKCVLWFFLMKNKRTTRNYAIR